MKYDYEYCENWITDVVNCRQPDLEDAAREELRIAVETRQKPLSCMSIIDHLNKYYTNRRKASIISDHLCTLIKGLQQLNRKFDTNFKPISTVPSVTQTRSTVR